MATSRLSTSGPTVLTPTEWEDSPHSPPNYDEEAEQNALASGLVNAPALASLLSALQPKDFFFPRHGGLLRGMAELAEAGSPVDEITLAAHLMNEAWFREIGGRAYLHQIKAALVAFTRVNSYTAIVKDHSRRRQEVRVAEEVIAGRLTWREAAELLKAEDDEATQIGYLLAPLDWATRAQDGEPDVEYHLDPYIPKGGRIWVWGATGTAKSLWCLWAAAGLSRRAIRVSYFSEENPTREDLRRLARLRPDPEYFRFFHRTGMDLLDPQWIALMLRTTLGDEAVFLDSWTDLWRGDESDNRAVQQFDATVLKPLQAQAATPVVIHHTGHKNPSGERAGATAGRGASSLGQKADVTLEFKSEGEDTFTIIYGKNRMGGIRFPPRTYRIVDDEDGGLSMTPVGSPQERAIGELAEKMMQAILAAPNGYVTTNEVRKLVGGKKDRQSQALLILESEHRVRMSEEKVLAPDGSLRHSKVWRPSQAGGALRDRLLSTEVDG